MRNKRIVYLILLILSSMSILSFIGLLAHFEVKIANNQVFEISDEINEDKIKCTYFPGSLPAGVMVLQGFSSDQISIKSIAMEFNFQGYHVFTFDYSGHGRSSGHIDFNNTATDKLAQQLKQVKEIFKQKSGLDDKQIVLLGQSYGARIALQEQTLDSNAVAGLVLIGVQINLDTENNADIFTGVSDPDLEWVKELGENNPQTNISILTGSWDDILTPTGAILLYEKLTNRNYSEIGSFYITVFNHSRELKFFDRVVHNYEIYSPEIISAAKIRVGNFLGINTSQKSSISTTRLRNISWLIIIIGFYVNFLTAIGLKKKQEIRETEKSMIALEIENTRRYALYKIVTFVLAIPVMIIFALFTLILGMDSPVFAISYTSFFFGLGFIETLFLWKEKMGGIKGKWKMNEEIKSLKEIEYKNLLFALIFLLIITIVISFFVQTGLWFFFPFRKLPWFFILTPFCAIGFYSSILQLKMIANYKINYSKNLLAFFGVILSIIIISVLGSIVFGISGILIGLIELLITLGFIFLTGICLNKIMKNDLLIALLLSLLLQWIVLPQSVVFRNPFY